MAWSPSLAATPLHHGSAFRTAAETAILPKGPDLLLLFRCEHAPGGEHRFHALLLHLSLQGVHLVHLLHDRVVIGIIRAQQFTEFNVAQFQIRARLDGSFLGVYTDLVEASNLLVRETKILAQAGIFRHAQKARAATESAPAAALPTHPALSGTTRPSLPAELATVKPLRALTPLALSAPAKLMLALPGAGPLWGAFLSPTDNRCRQQNHKT
jgi:hypothetical protein